MKTGHIQICNKIVYPKSLIFSDVCVIELNINKMSIKKIKGKCDVRNKNSVRAGGKVVFCTHSVKKKKKKKVM